MLQASGKFDYRLELRSIVVESAGANGELVSSAFPSRLRSASDRRQPLFPQTQLKLWPNASKRCSAQAAKSSSHPRSSRTSTQPGSAP